MRASQVLFWTAVAIIATFGIACYIVAAHSLGVG